jgi:hypothetical protein
MCEYVIDPPQIIYGSVWSNCSPLPVKKGKGKDKKKSKEPMGFYQRKHKGGASCIKQ